MTVIKHALTLRDLIIAVVIQDLVYHQIIDLVQVIVTY